MNPRSNPSGVILPAVQLAAMRAVMQIKSFTKFAVKDGDTLNLCADILMRMKAYKQQNLPELRIYGEIKILLANKGVLKNNCYYSISLEAFL